MTTLIDKLEKSLALAKELKLSDAQVHDLFALILEIPVQKTVFVQQPNIFGTPNVWPNTIIGNTNDNQNNMN